MSQNAYFWSIFRSESTQTNPFWSQMPGNGKSLGHLWFYKVWDQLGRFRSENKKNGHFRGGGIWYQNPREKIKMTKVCFQMHPNARKLLRKHNL